MKNQSKNIFLLAGRTGGPFFPLPTIAKNLVGVNPIYVGVRNSFEEKVALQRDLQLEFLPEVKLGLLSFRKQKPSEIIKNLSELITSLFLFLVSIVQSFSLLLKYKPKLIISTGSFLAIPLVTAMQITNILKITKTSLVVHQQDPLPGITNKLTVKLAKLKTCVFPYTQYNFIDFASSLLIPNPIDPDQFNLTSRECFQRLEKINPPLHKFLTGGVPKNVQLSNSGDTIENSVQTFTKNSTKYKNSIYSPKPLLFIFGGGSGSQDINNWLNQNFKNLISKFRIIHLYGALQTDFLPNEHPDYFSYRVFIDEMPLVLILSDLVICRAGLGSISELEYLQKPAFLVPLPHSHQELNTELVKDRFQILKQKEISAWVEQIFSAYPHFFSKQNFPPTDEQLLQLKNYYRLIQNLLDKA